MSKKRKISIIDETLREGLQTPGLVYSQDEKVEIAKLLGKANLDGIQAGYPSAHESEFMAVKEIMKMKKGLDIDSKISAHGRCYKPDILKIANLDVDQIDLHATLNGNEKMDKIKKNINLAKEKGFDRIKISLLDVGKHSTQDCIKVVKNIESFVDIITLPDTSGIMTPLEFSNKISEIKKDTSNKAKLAIHCHNDRGMALANSIIAIRQGVEIIETTIGGIGERNGIADTLSVYSIMTELGYDCELELEDLMKVYEKVNKITTERANFKIIEKRKPILGDWVTTHSAGTHIKSGYTGKIDKINKYLDMENEISLGLYVGKRAVKEAYKKLGISIKDEEAKKIRDQIKNISSRELRDVRKEELPMLLEKIRKT